MQNDKGKEMFVKEIASKESHRRDFIFGYKGEEAHGHLALSGSIFADKSASTDDVQIWYFRDIDQKTLFLSGSILKNG